MNTTLVGQTLLDQYRVDAFIASGGMGAVYRVFDLKRNVPLAMKVLHAELAGDPSIFKRFEREARALKKLAHPNIVPFYGVYQTQGFAFLLVRFIDGQTLKEVMRAYSHKPLPLLEAFVYVKALCAALGYAHANQVVHCDVKPANVMVERSGTIYLTDFGIARNAESNATTLASLGTAAYMSPEQIRGESVTSAADIYALGVLLFELLTGLRPFRSQEQGTEKSTETTNEYIRSLHLNAAPPDPASLNPEITPALAQVVLKALSKEPYDRYETTQALLNAACAAAGLKVEDIPDLAKALPASPPMEQTVRTVPPVQEQTVDTNKIGRYVVLREIGRGGMATVYAARDPMFNREVAIKMLPSELLHDPNFRSRFEREAQTVAALEHSAIVPVYDYGEAQGRPYFVMRLMVGNTLAERIAKGPMPLTDAAHIMARIASALDEAHARGIIHRDLKPGNILFDQYNEPYLSDFGIAKLKEGGATLTGENIIGTPAYMSPEQGRGEADLDGRSDIYSLGCILYEMLSGKVPFEASTPMGQVVKHLTTPIPNILEVRPDLPRSIQEVMSRALAKRKYSRYSKAIELAHSLMALAEGKDLSSVPDSLSETVPATRSPVSPGGAGMPPQRPPSGQIPIPVQKPPPGTLPSVQVSTPVVQAPKKRSLGWVVWVMVALLLAGIAFVGLKYAPVWLDLAAPTSVSMLTTPTPLSTATLMPETATPTEPSATDTPQPTDTPAPVSPTPDATELPVEPTLEATQTLYASTGPVIGGADKIAFVKDNDIWIANLDATDTVRLTNTGGNKSDLQWTPDGIHVKFIMGKCAVLVNIEDQSVDPILCANWADYLGAFEISPDGTQVAISTSDGLIILPYDLDALRGIKRQDQLVNAASCLKNNTEHETKSVRWSADGKMLAVIIVGSEAGRSVDLVWVVAITCGQKPVTVDTFPATRFTMTNYTQYPSIQSLGWDGDVNFALNVHVLATYGDFYTYNMAINKGEKVNPLNNKRCCYRDFTWSPDGQYILFAYLDVNVVQSVQLYYVEYGLLGQGQIYTPMPFAEDFFPFNQNVASPQPALRPAP